MRLSPIARGRNVFRSVGPTQVERQGNAAFRTNEKRNEFPHSRASTRRNEFSLDAVDILSILS